MTLEKEQKTKPSENSSALNTVIKLESSETEINIHYWVSSPKIQADVFTNLENI